MFSGPGDGRETLVGSEGIQGDDEERGREGERESGREATCRGEWEREGEEICRVRKRNGEKKGWRR